MSTQGNRARRLHDSRLKRAEAQPVPSTLPFRGMITYNAEVMGHVLDAVLKPFVTALEATGDYRVLRRLTPQEQFRKKVPANALSGLF